MPEHSLTSEEALQRPKPKSIFGRSIVLLPEPAKINNTPSR